MPTQIVGAPINGGASQPLTARIYDMPRCARAPASLCAIAEPSEDSKEMIFTAFAPQSEPPLLPCCQSLPQDAAVPPARTTVRLHSRPLARWIVAR